MNEHTILRSLSLATGGAVSIGRKERFRLLSKRKLTAEVAPPKKTKTRYIGRTGRNIRHNNHTLKPQHNLPCSSIERLDSVANKVLRMNESRERWDMNRESGPATEFGPHHDNEDISNRTD